MKTIALSRITAAKDTCIILMSGTDEAIEIISALRNVNPAFNPLFELDKLLAFLIEYQVRAYAWLEGTEFNDPMIVPEMLMFNKRLQQEGLLLEPSPQSDCE